MTEQECTVDWNLLLVASSPNGPERVLNFLAGGVAACGGWVLSKSSSGETCAEIDFEFPRANCVEVYSVLLATGVTLSQEAHLQLTELCQCTMHLFASRGFHLVRLHLTVYTHAEVSPETLASDEVATRAA
jgi:hypothetical protein